MAILGSIVKKAIEIRSNLAKNRGDAFLQQQKVLRSLLKKAEFTAIGDAYDFSALYRHKQVDVAFRKMVPAHDYHSMFKNWWFRSLNGEPYVCWPSEVKYFALSSGTSEAASKHIPVTSDMLRAIRKTSVRQMLSMAEMDLPKSHFEKGVLMIGGSTHLSFNGTYYEGDLSGITTGNIPFWFQHFYKPGPRISRHTSWNDKLEDITKNAAKWDIGVICGVPAWIQIIFERIIAYYGVKTIHDVWPNLRIYVSGGVSTAPYMHRFEKLTGRPLIFLDTYLASEGFMAYQEGINANGAMRLVTDIGIYFEFIPFNEHYFDADGNMLPNVETLNLHDVKEGESYALLISTCAGAWRYLIGDVIQFTNVEACEVIITGRTKHFLSLCGEHLSVDNMNQAIRYTADKMNIDVPEFTVCGVPHGNRFAHHWYVAVDAPVDKELFKRSLDDKLKKLNDDYRVERSHALENIILDVLPQSVFLNFLAKRGKLGAQHKFPRVLKGKMLTAWEEYLQELNWGG